MIFVAWREELGILKLKPRDKVSAASTCNCVCVCFPPLFFFFGEVTIPHPSSNISAFNSFLVPVVI